MESAEGLRLALFTDTFPPQVNGVARTLERLVRAIEARGGAVQVVTVADPESVPLPQVERWPSIPFWAYPQLRIAAPSVGRARDVIDRWKPTLVHATTEFGVGWSGLLAAREAGVPVVTSYHTHFKAYLEFYNLSFLHPIAWPYFRWFHNRGRLTFAPSGIVARELATHGLHGVRVWSRGVDGARFSPSFRTAEARARLGVTRDGQVLAVYVGRLAREKGIHAFLKAIPLVTAQVGDRVKFALVGDGPAEAECHAMAPADVVFTGRLDGRALSEAYAAADLFVFPSITETFGNVVLEAMGSGVAVLAPNEGATTEYATPETSVHFPVREPAVLAAEIVRLAGDRAARERVAAAGLAAARARTWDAVWDGLVRDYRDALADSQTAAEMSAIRR